MKRYVVDIASLGQQQLVAALKKYKEEIIGVTLSCDVKNYHSLCNFNINAIRTASDVRVYKGAQRPMLKPEFALAHTCVDTQTEESFEALHASNFIIKATKANPGLELVCLGPLTNVALAILKDEETMKNIGRIYVAGGALLGYQSTTPVAHHNILADAEAAEIVFKSGVPITLIPVNAVQNLPKAAFDIAFGNVQTENWDAYITIDTGLGFTRGQTVIDLVGRNPINGDITPGIKQTVVTKLV